ncbi:hypothetical protein ABIA31_007043 [Catenulispora sp. MAP5-51]|uniref:hypothetical protein n=1 Tax=Catenulispora sp. MAP5-51 TaxID=3156298 RepID=UPI00351519EF
MSSGVALLVVLHPPKVVGDPLAFEQYLHKLAVTAYQVDFGHPDTLAAPPHAVIGSAGYTAANDSTNTIYQLTDLFDTTLYSAAVAVIDVDSAILAKYTSPESLVNVVLSVTRDGKKIREDSLDYDVQLWGSSGSPYSVPSSFALGVAGTSLTLDGSPGGGIVGLYLPLPDPAFDAGSGTAYLVPPADGSAPSFSDIKNAVDAILAEDPTGMSDPTDLTAQQCLHIARELVSNRYAAPLPAPSSAVPVLYTTGSDDDRKHFESTLQSYYATLDAEASRLAGFIYAWSAALNCNGLTKAAAQAALTFPLRVTSTPGTAQAAEAGVVLHN